jgi:WD40 repeat protein
MSSSSSSRDLVEALAEEFLDRRRRGESTTPEEYIARHPELAEEILELFPVLLTTPEEYAARHSKLADKIRELLPDLLSAEKLGSDFERGTGSATRRGEAAGRTVLGRLGEFRLVRLIGRGGMGVVYEAEQESLGRRVALKVLPATTLTDEKQVRRFEREARSAARLHHTHIVPVFGAGQYEGTHFYIMQFIEGHGLDAVLDELKQLRQSRSTGHVEAGVPNVRGGAAEIDVSVATGQFLAGGEGAAPTATATLASSQPAWDSPGPEPSPSEPGTSSLAAQSGGPRFSETDRRFARGVARIGVQVAEALAYAHTQGILHRDIKPSNLLLDRNGDVWVTDFGLAKAVGAADLTQTGDIVGTLRYMAPERFRGEADARADIYALGLVLYELLALRPAFDEKDRASLIHQVTQREPTRLRTLNRKVPFDLETIVHKAIAREPAERYATAGGLAEDLQRFIEGRPIRARRVRAVERVWRWCQRNTAVAVLLGHVALALVVGTAVSTYFAIRATRGERLARHNEAQALLNAQRADRETVRARDEKRLSENLLYLAKINLAQRAWQDSRLDVLRTHLNPLEPRQPEDSDPRAFEWYYLQRLTKSGLRTRRGESGVDEQVLLVGISPDGSRIVSVDGDGSATVWETATGRPVHVLRGAPGRARGAVYSPDGRSIATLGHGIVTLWDAVTGRRNLDLKAQSDVHGRVGMRRIAFSPDGARMASACDDGTAIVFDVFSGRETLVLRGHTGYVSDVAFSPGGDRLATTSLDRTVKLWDTASGAVVWSRDVQGGPGWNLAYSPLGTYIASSNESNVVNLLHAETGGVAFQLQGHTSRTNGMAFSADGQRLATTSFDSTVRLWDTSTGQEIRTLRGHTAASTGVAFCRDGRLIVSEALDHTVKLWDVSTDQEARTLRGHCAGVWSVAFSRDGRRLASAGRDCTVRLWDAESGQEIRTLRGHVGEVRCVAFAPDGRALASTSSDQTVRVWDADTGQETFTLRGHTASTWGADYSPDGRTIASACLDRTVKLWDAATGREIRTLRGHAKGVVSVVFSPSGRQLATGSDDQTVGLWDVASGQLVQTLSGHSGPINGVAYSPDGRWLASSGDKTVNLWDTATGQLVRSLSGHAAVVWSAAFDPDGRRLASASGDEQTRLWDVKLWDVATGQEVLVLQGHTAPVHGVAFSPDGYSIASASWDQTIKLWDARPLTPELEVFREAQGLVEFLFEQKRPTAAVQDRIRRDPTISEAVRKRALELAEPYGRTLMVHDAERRIRALYARPMFRPEVLEAVRRDTSLTESVKEAALALAAQVSENADSLDGASWNVVREPNVDLAAYRLALLRAEAACRLVPGNGDFLTTLGLAHYRLGNVGEAAATLELADRLNSPLRNGPIPPDLAFLALAQHRLGQGKAARATLARLRELMKRPERVGNEEGQAFLREALVIEQDLAFPADPFAD